MSADSTLVAPKPRSSTARFPRPALAVAGAGAVLTVLATQLTWTTASVTAAGTTDSLVLKGTDPDMNGRFTLVLGLLALAVVAVLALRAVKGLWILLPVLGALVLLVSWAQTVKVSNTLDEAADLTSGSAASGLMQTEMSNGPGLWLTVLAGLLLLATAVLVPVLRRRPGRAHA